MVIKVAVADRFRFKMVPSIRNLYMLGTREVHYIGGAEVLPVIRTTNCTIWGILWRQMITSISRLKLI